VYKDDITFGAVLNNRNQVPSSRQTGSSARRPCSRLPSYCNSLAVDYVDWWVWESTRGLINVTLKSTLARRLTVPSLLDGFLDGHVNTSGRMGSNQSKARSLPNSIAPTDARRIIMKSNFPFRVLVMGRANAGKTSILQRVCETTESPKIYRGGEEVRGPNLRPEV
jgi:hypothetical protein